VARYPDEPSVTDGFGGRGGEIVPPRRGKATVVMSALLAVTLLTVAMIVAAQAIPSAQRPTLGGAPVGSANAAGAASPTPTERQSTGAPAQQITLAFAGDVHFAERVAPRLNDPASAFGPIAAVLSRADLAMVNLETAVTQRGTPEPKEFTFRAPPAAFTALRSAGVDVASMANNHGADYGLVGLQDSLTAAAKAKFPVVGIGLDAAHAYASWFATVRGHQVAILAASQIRDRTLSAWTAGTGKAGIASAFSDSLVTAVRAARQRATFVIVYVHWGTEGEECPNADQQQLADRLARAGATAVVGTHAHLLLGGGWLGRTYVGYGLGNFLWWRDNAFSNDTGVLTLTIRGGKVAEAVLTPARIDARGVPLPAVGAESARIQTEWDRVRRCAGLDATPP
jgi:poly-gamma-glutamate capsule biosynthesis protein CapA/YwtB (metallophosphatase superfamily)